ncbi:thioredoxin family protein [Mesonia aestuariivivens]|uniref:Thioredoxin family protein n=1 Tax=Mesonia aestuariivivens TaxID=2796128 RepID=A0ABS6W1F8_9FLAO|nr:thioredoxin family protein [Mesonia aestuariivivens]MBW2961683.1 thioredoxin family protein [Mesonia aestuariivivens]
MKYLFLLSLLFYCGSNFAQAEIDWLNFKQLQEKLHQETKPVFIYFYADWCVFCKKMDRHAFQNQEVIKTLSENFYALKMNAETTDTIIFERNTFINEEVETHRNPTHQLAKLLASRKNQAFTLPAIILLNNDFKVINRKFTYLTTEKMLQLIKISR